MVKLDILNREEFVTNLVNLTENISDKKVSTSFAIDGSWGCGKSFVLDMYEQQLGAIQSEKTAMDKYFIIRYNCWKYDYYDEPLVAIVAVLIDIINQKTRLWNDEQKKARVLGVLKAVGTTLLSMVNDGIKDKIGVDIKATYETLKNSIESEEERVEQSHEYDMYFSFNQALHRLQDLFAELCRDQTLVFVVDELDRCLPEYSIKVLERLHHLVENSSNVITVLSIDKNQLKTSVQKIFGFVDPDKYLEKFIQFEICLDCGVVSDQVTEKYSDYIALFDREICPYDESTEEFIQKIFKGISARTQEQLIKRATIAHTLLFSEPKPMQFMCLELLLTVIDTCYPGKIVFCKFLGEYSRFVCSTPEPPFSGFINERFEEIPITNVSTYGMSDKSIFSCSASKSLYTCILFLWYNMFFCNENIRITIKNEPIRNKLEAELDDLKRFHQMVNYIK